MGQSEFFADGQYQTNMTEEFLHYLWKFQLFEKAGLQTTAGESINIIHPGYHNHDAGPDFSEARIQLGQQLWVGNLEIHIKSSDWLRHGHQRDAAYKNVVLHVVYEHDKEVLNHNEQPLPVLELKGLFDEYLYWRYEQLIQHSDPIPCAPQFKQVDNMIVESMLERSLVERLQQKSERIMELWDANGKDWNETFYQWMAHGFGLKVNAEPMLMLARQLPQGILARHKDNLFQLEALLFGVSGMLTDNDDDYALELKKEFEFLARKYQLGAFDPVIWKYSRIRPAAFPDLRIGQFAALIHRSENLFSKILGLGSMQVLNQLLGDSPSLYWREHYRFGLPHKRAGGGMGERFQQLLVINVIVPFLFIYGRLRDEAFYQQRAFDLLDQMAGEDNKVTRIYRALGLSITSAFSSQAVLQLHNSYCSPKKCLNCSVGTFLLKS